MDTITYLTILRLFHITCGVFWGGAAIYLSAFVMPAVSASGPEGGKFMRQLAQTNKLPQVMTFASTTTVLAGILLIYKLSDGFSSEWMGSTHGIILSTGGFLAISAWLEGLFITRPNVIKLTKLGQEIGTNQPSAEQIEQMGNCRKKIMKANSRAAILILIAVIAMSIARYL